VTCWIGLHYYPEVVRSYRRADVWDIGGQSPDTDVSRPNGTDGVRPYRDLLRPARAVKACRWAILSARASGRRTREVIYRLQEVLLFVLEVCEGVTDVCYVGGTRVTDQRAFLQAFRLGGYEDFERGHVSAEVP
jgi:hypothetical protein